MTEAQVLDEIFSTFKWYIGLFEDGHARQLKKRYLEGTLKQSTKDKIIDKCGYVIEQEKTYSKAI